MTNEPTGTPRYAANRREMRHQWPLALVLGIGLLILILESCMSVPPANNVPTTNLTGADNGKTIHVHSGNLIVITLDSNASTGYQWAIEKSDDALLTLKQSDYAATPNAPPGSGGSQIFTFVAKGAGTVDLQLKYWRSFAGDKSIIQRFAITIQVQGS